MSNRNIRHSNKLYWQRSRLTTIRSTIYDRLLSFFGCLCRLVSFLWPLRGITNSFKVFLCGWLASVDRGGEVVEIGASANWRNIIYEKNWFRRKLDRSPPIVSFNLFTPMFSRRCRSWMLCVQLDRSGANSPLWAPCRHHPVLVKLKNCFQSWKWHFVRIEWVSPIGTREMYMVGVLCHGSDPTATNGNRYGVNGKLRSS